VFSSSDSFTLAARPLSIDTIDQPREPSVTGEPTRGSAPVFVVGSPRSGTTLLYHMLLSAGRFAIYRAETHVFNTLAPRFGDLKEERNRRAMAACYVRSDMFAVSGLDATSFQEAVDARCRNPGDFLRILMELIATKQGAERWAETTPVHLLHMLQIKAVIPEALFIHVIRDGRDVSVSMVKQRWIRPFPWHRRTPELAAGAFWMWVVETGERLGAVLPRDYLSVSYERLIADPPGTLDQIGGFIGQPIDYQQVLRTGIGSVSRPNTSFPDKPAAFGGRWRQELDEERARALEALLEPTLIRYGYAIEYRLNAGERRRAAGTRSAYRAWFAARHALKRTPLARRLVSLSLFEPGAVNDSGSG
jgi:LPS sulfotransferase NodH